MSALKFMPTEAGTAQLISIINHLQHLCAGVSLMQSETRARPNCFHFRRQVLILERAGAGSADRQFQADSE